jgi:cytidylate kinase
MTIHLTERQTEALERAERHWHSRHQAAAGGPTATGITIALTREAGGLGTSVAHEVGARLGWPVYDNELLQAIAREMGLRVDLLESVDERRQSWILECLEAFSDTPFVSENSFVRHVIQTVLSLGAHGQCVIVGRGAAFILPAETTLRVRLVGNLKDRVAVLSRQLGVSEAEAARKAEAIDRERTRFVKDHFQKDPADPLLYDLILNTSRWSAAQCAEFIVQAARQMDRGGAGT